MGASAIASSRLDVTSHALARTGAASCSAETKGDSASEDASINSAASPM